IDTFRKQEEKEKEKDPTRQSIEIQQIHEIDSAGGVDVDAPVITLVNGILSEGIRRRASDIHVEPYEKRFRVRMRIDGTLHEVLQIPLEMRRAAIARLKIMSR